jgi:hypothetical protein
LTKRAISNLLAGFLAHDCREGLIGASIVRRGDPKMSTKSVTMSNRLQLREFESFHRARLAPVQQRPSLGELAITALITLIMAPFGFVTFMVIPVMGQVTVGFALLLTCIYLFYRRSLAAAAVTIGCSVLFWTALFLTIQAIKNNLEVLLFFFTAMGIPVSAMYCMFIGTRIWSIRGGLD